MKFRPVIFGGYVNGYSLARTFYELYEIDSVVCDVKKNITKNSYFCKYIIVPDPQKNEDDFIRFVKELGEKLVDKDEIPVLLVTNDIWLIPLGKHKEILKSVYKYTFSDWEVIKLLANKSSLYKLSDTIGVSYPKTHRYNIENSDFKHLLPPLLIKPSNVPMFINSFPRFNRNHIFSSYQSAEQFLHNVYSTGYEDDMIIQEFIPGGVENLYTCTSYSDRKGNIKGVSVGCKLSQYPEEAGTITSGLVNYKSEVVELTRKILDSQNFFGIANTEFKFDKRYNSFKLIEVNARPGMWNYSTVLSGVNLIEMLIDDIIFNKELCFKEGKTQIIWSRINEKEILRNVRNTENEDLVINLIKNKKVYDPLKNDKEKISYKIDLFILYMHSFLAKSYRNLIKKK